MREFSDVEDADGAGGEDCISPSWMRRRCGDADGLCFSSNVKGYTVGYTSRRSLILNLIEHGARERKHTAGCQSERCAGHIIHTPTPGRTNNILLRYKEVG